MRESEAGRGRSWTELWVREKAGLSLVPREPRSVNWTRVVLGGRCWALTPLISQSLGLWAASPYSAQRFQTFPAHMVFIHEGSWDLLAATLPAVGGKWPSQNGISWATNSHHCRLGLSANILSPEPSTARYILLAFSLS